MTLATQLRDDISATRRQSFLSQVREVVAEYVPERLRDRAEVRLESLLIRWEKEVVRDTEAFR